MNAPNMYNLPTIHFIGGSAQELLFHVFFHNIKKPFDLLGCTANFSVINYINKNGAPLINKEMTISEGDFDQDGLTVSNILRVILASADTFNMVGKFIYQISIKDNNGRVEIPGQGIFYIANNINKSYVSRSGGTVQNAGYHTNDEITWGVF